MCLRPSRLLLLPLFILTKRACALARQKKAEPTNLSDFGFLIYRLQFFAAD
ncbi:MAG: hypothetical protein ACJA2Q_001252 [Pseudohongiellaceae bacterium]|jgi:hypothetical protein